MKITITLEVSEAEVPVVERLMHAFREITADVAVRSAVGAPPALQPGVYSPQPGPGRPNGAESSDRRAAGAPMLIDSREQALHFARTLGELRMSGANVPTLMAGINETFARASSEEGYARLFRLFFQELCRAMLDHAESGSGALPSAAPYISALHLLAVELRKDTRTQLTKHLMALLAKPRSGGGQRRQVFLPAEAFALLVAHKFVKIDGALSTIKSLIGSPDTRCAGLTMLGKTVELALATMKDPAMVPQLRGLLSALRLVSEQEFDYDVTYSTRNIVWVLNTIESEDSSIAHSPSKDVGEKVIPVSREPALSISGLGKLDGAKSPVYAMAFDEHMDELITGGRGGDVVAWSSSGDMKQTLRFPCADHFIASMDLHARTSQLFVAGTLQAPEDGSMQRASSGAVAHYRRGTGADDAWTLVGTRQQRLDCTLAVKAIDLPTASSADPGQVLVAESAEGEHRICLIDLAEGPLALGTPSWVGSSHTKPVTCLAAMPVTNTFASGSHDSKIMLWDVRVADGFTAETTAAGGGHREMVSCIDIDGHVLTSASADGYVALWDLRNLAKAVTAKVGLGSAVTQVGIGPQAGTAVATTSTGVFVVDFELGVYRQAAPITAERVGKYHSLRWNTSKSMLFVGGTYLDIYQVDGDEEEDEDDMESSGMGAGMGAPAGSYDG